MIVPFVLGEKEYRISAYNTSQEKEILLLASFGVYDLKKVFNILNFSDYEGLSEDEMKVILYRHREISLGDEIDVRFKCDNCGQGNDTVLTASGFVIPGKRNDSDIKKFLKKFDEEKMQEYVDFDVDDLDIDEYEKLRQRIIDNQMKIDFTRSANCMKCGTKKLFNIGDTKYIVDILSDDNLMSLYKAYNFLNFFGNYSKTDIDGMYPFERNIFIGLLKKTKEDMNK